MSSFLSYFLHASFYSPKPHLNRDREVYATEGKVVHLSGRDFGMILELGFVLCERRRVPTLTELLIWLLRFVG
uniref:Uncharacterized protein n=1 Tax=Lotus japonicus TaxID=34305 RepID=I3S5V1_LOTJA|nr:unknown [Lotus japonicus]